jgi:hypothetical protein
MGPDHFVNLGIERALNLLSFGRIVKEQPAFSVLRAQKLCSKANHAEPLNPSLPGHRKSVRQPSVESFDTPSAWIPLWQRNPLPGRNLESME